MVAIPSHPTFDLVIIDQFSRTHHCHVVAVRDIEIIERHRWVLAYLSHFSSVWLGCHPNYPVIVRCKGINRSGSRLSGFVNRNKCWVFHLLDYSAHLAERLRVSQPLCASAIWVGIGVAGVWVTRLCRPKTTHQCDEPDGSGNDREIGQRVVDSGRVLYNQLGDDNEDDR